MITLLHAAGIVHAHCDGLAVAGLLFVALLFAAFNYGGAK